jgi:hypothetical protein
MSRTWLALLLLVLLPAQGARANGDAMPPTIEQVKAAHERRLLALPGVVSVGIGRDDQGRSVIVVGLDKPRPQTEAAVPRELDGYGVRIDVVGMIRAQ